MTLRITSTLCDCCFKTGEPVTIKFWDVTPEAYAEMEQSAGRPRQCSSLAECLLPEDEITVKQIPSLTRQVPKLIPGAFCGINTDTDNRDDKNQTTKDSQ